MTDVPQGSWPAPVGPPAQVPIAAASAVPIGSPPAQQREPGRAGYWGGALIIVVGSFVSIVWLLAVAITEPYPNYPWVPVPGDRLVELQSGAYSLFDDNPGLDRPTHRPPTVHITGPNGEEPVTPSDTPNSYFTEDGRSGYEFATIRPSVAGQYRVQVTAGEPGNASAAERVSIGEPAPIGSYALAMLFGAVTFVAGVAVLVTTGVRRARWRALHRDGAGRPNRADAS